MVHHFDKVSRVCIFILFHIIVSFCLIYNSDNFTDFCSQIMQSVPEMRLWAAAVEHREIPSFFSVVTLTAPLRSPPVVIREVMKSAQIHSGVIKGYNDTEVPAPTDGPTVKIIRHYRSDQSGHNGDRPDECVMCGHHLANVLTELHVGQTGTY